jgi:hypothetical protein
VADDESTVSYTVKELIERLERKIDQFLTLLHNKADRRDLAVLEQRVDTVERHVSALNQREAAQEKRTEWKRWLIPTIATLVLAGATVVSLIK